MSHRSIQLERKSPHGYISPNMEYGSLACARQSNVSAMKPNVLVKPDGIGRTLAMCTNRQMRCTDVLRLAQQRNAGEIICEKHGQVSPPNHIKHQFHNLRYNKNLLEIGSPTYHDVHGALLQPRHDRWIRLDLLKKLRLKLDLVRVNGSLDIRVCDSATLHCIFVKSIHVLLVGVPIVVFRIELLLVLCFDLFHANAAAVSGSQNDVTSDFGVGLFDMNLTIQI